MFTVCPKCALTLVVTAADLRVAQGYVRCGRCSSVFNALARLSEERGAQPAVEAGATAAAVEEDTAPAPAALPEVPQPQAAAPPSAAAEPEEAAEAQEISADELEFDPNRTDVNQVFVQPPPDPQWTAATGSFKALIAANQEPELPDSQVDVEIDADFLASILQAENLSPASEPPAAPAGAAQPSTPEPAPARAPTRPAAAPAAARPAPARPAARHAAARPRPLSQAAKSQPPPARARRAPPSTPPAGARPRPPQPREPRSELADELVEDLAQDSRVPAEESRVPAVLRRHAWAIGVALASLVLVAQILNHYRDDLAVSARFNRPLTALYSAFGVKLSPHWDLHAYDVRQLGAEVDPAGGGLITVRASIKNGAPQPQPLPLLRVTFQDRFGNRVAARDVAPMSYLPRNVPATSFLSAGQRIDAEIGFADPGTEAVGFEIDACLPASGGGIACVNDAALR
ncbi:MAG TPA: zinc-ribbon and DUF3426 domain-containing protein [Steroidobacteraceae bacterium]|nr:zinc-ribbon and DUF3426 domain-containing protein [Steroidobacteraceae bacterium]